MAKLNNVRITDEAQWFPYFTPPEGEGAPIEFLVRSTACSAYKKKQRSLAKRHLDRTPSSRFSGATNLSSDSIAVMQTDLALELCRGWRGIEKDDGTEDVYTPERAREIFDDPAFSDIVEYIHECGNNLSAHATAVVEGTAKNSKAASGS